VTSPAGRTPEPSAGVDGTEDVTDRPNSGPAPRYGEYAPAPPEPPRSAKPPVEVAPAVAPDHPVAAEPPHPVARHRGPTWDRVLTIGLLVLGILNVLTGIPQFLRLAETLDEAYAMQGLGDYTADSLASAIGIAVNAVNVVLLLVAVWLAVARLRAGKLAFWVPLSAGAASVIITITLLAVAMLGDPSLAAYLDGSGSTAP
jgi:hypothetical protein